MQLQRESIKLIGTHYRATKNCIFILQSIGNRDAKSFSTIASAGLN